jgi:hypothetical protein
MRTLQKYYNDTVLCHGRTMQPRLGFSCFTFQFGSCLKFRGVRRDNNAYVQANVKVNIQMFAKIY